MVFSEAANRLLCSLGPMIQSMALNDLLESLENAASTLDRLNECQVYAKVWREVKAQIEDAVKKGRTDEVKKIMVESIAIDYSKTMGSSNDLTICEGNHNVPAEMSEDEANDLLEKAKRICYSICFSGIPKRRGPQESTVECGSESTTQRNTDILGNIANTKG
jgi:hypothetical protein